MRANSQTPVYDLNMFSYAQEAIPSKGIFLHSAQNINTESTSTTVSSDNGAVRKAISGSWGGFIALIVILTVNFLLYSRSLNGYFFADDYVHVSWLYKVFSGQPELIWQNFSSNWMQAQGTQFYRPLISLTLVLDYLLAGAHPFVFHFTNLIYHACGAFFLFLLTGRLLSGFSLPDRFICALTAALLFVSSPLHPEVVSWIIGRVDSVCTMFFLASCWLYVLNRQENRKGCLFSAGMVFILSLLSKEMAIMLPPVLFFAELVVLGGENVSFGTRFVAAIKNTLLFWVLLGCYLGWRFFVLGTVFGGYGGSLGPELAGDFYQRWWKSGSLFRLFFPLNAIAIPQPTAFVKLFAASYVIALTGFIIKACMFKEIRKTLPFVCFFAIFFFLSLLPLYQVFNLNSTLMCSRFVYLATAPFSVLLALLIYTPGFTGAISGAASREGESTSSSGIKKPSGNALAIVIGQLILSVCVITLFALAAWKNNLPWSHASTHVKMFRAQLENAARSANGGKIVILNIPQEVEGAHVLYNAAMLSVLLSPPLTVPGFAKEVITFEPVSYGEQSLINISRLKRLLNTEKIAGVYYWSSSMKRLVMIRPEAGEPTSLSLPVDSLSVDWKGLGDCDLSCLHVVSPPLSLNPLAVDELRITLAVDTIGQDVRTPVLKLLWSGDTAPADCVLQQPLQADGKEHTYLFSLSEYKPWIASSRITGLNFQIPLTKQVQAKNIKCPIRITAVELDNISSRSIELKLDDAIEGIDGIFQLFEPRQFIYDGSKVKNLLDCSVEISQCNTWFEHATHTFRDKQEAAQHLLLRKLKAPKGNFVLEPSMFPSSGFYSVRVIGDGKCYASDPIYLQVTR